jgi:uncharacterized protein
MFTWDDNKRLKNVHKHGIDFADAIRIFDGFTLTAEDDRGYFGEQRFLTLGLLHDRVVSVAHTEHDRMIRIISIRKATKHEAQYYFSQIAN